MTFLGASRDRHHLQSLRIINPGKMLLNRIQRSVLTFLLLLCLSTGMVVGFNSISVEGGVNLGQPDKEIPATLFGMHLHHVATTPTYRTDPPITEHTPWPSVPIPTWRLVAAYVEWFALEPQKGEWNFEILDKSLELAEKHQVEPLMYLGFSPRWASQRPDEPSAYGPGKAAPPQNIEDWRNYVRTVATRYKGRIHYYELWNEPNGYKRFYTGTVAEMVELSREAYQILKEVDPTITVVSPSATGDWGSSPGVEWLEEFLSQGGGDYADVIGYHFYVMPGPP
ncbi:MAG: GH39 family glycosyl hydrolase, partial [Planktothrix sp.]